MAGSVFSVRAGSRPAELISRRRARHRWWLLGPVVTLGSPAVSWAQGAAPAPQRTSPDLVNQILQFLYTIAHAIGQATVDTIQRILPQAKIPVDLVDPIGFLTVLTLFVLLAGLARRIAWIIVGVGWLLIGVRIALVIAGR